VDKDGLAESTWRWRRSPRRRWVDSWSAWRRGASHPWRWGWCRTRATASRFHHLAAAHTSVDGDLITDIVIQQSQGRNALASQAVACRYHGVSAINGHTIHQSKFFIGCQNSYQIVPLYIRLEKRQGGRCTCLLFLHSLECARQGSAARRVV
jgi:hypothetical protein